MELYPLKFKTQFYEKIWGGNKIRSIFHKDYSPLKNCGETWELSGVRGKESVIINGELEGKTINELISLYKSELVGGKVYEQFGDKFPLLIKFIDANDDLSIQVHPDDELAMKRHSCTGKTEMWYIIQADEGAKLISGFRSEMDKDIYRKKLSDKTLKEILNFEEVKSGDVFYIPAGRVHAIGKGIFLAEIQQSSDITYRIYDWDRLDAEGRERELHTEQALEAIDFTHYDSYKTDYKYEKNETVGIVSEKFFTTNFLEFDKQIIKDYSQIDSFVIYVCVEGRFEMKYSDSTIQVEAGEVVLLPAALKKIAFIPVVASKVLEVYV
ncbi:MAG: mannose-6-phosphate isomerase [Bacteroidota bacterium]|nr:mannose-6-phosphate isomerase [Bacteroidota bacterium]